MLMRRKASRRHAATGPPPPYIFLGSTLPPLASHAFAFLAMVKLWPLQSFLPLQSWLPLLQLPLPLQSFVPSQWTPFIALPLPAKATAGAIKVASAPAIATPFRVPFFMCEPPCLRLCYQATDHRRLTPLRPKTRLASPHGT